MGYTMQQEQETLLVELPANTDFTIHIAALEKDGHLSQADFASLNHTVFDGPTLNPFMGLTRCHWKSVRATVQALFRNGSPIKEDISKGADSKYLHKACDVTMLLPAQVGDYTDFYSSYNHAYNLGCMFRGPENAL